MEYVDGMNMYDFVAGSPIDWVDPEGMDRWTSDELITLIIRTAKHLTIVHSDHGWTEHDALKRGLKKIEQGTHLRERIKLCNKLLEWIRDAMAHSCLKDEDLDWLEAAKATYNDLCKGPRVHYRRFPIPERAPETVREILKNWAKSPAVPVPAKALPAWAAGGRGLDKALRTTGKVSTGIGVAAAATAAILMVVPALIAVGTGALGAGAALAY